MYINKVVFLEWYEVSKLADKFKFLISDTDYGTTELIGNMISDAIADWEAYKGTYDIADTVSYGDFKEECENALGSDLYEMLADGRVDFCLICP